MKIELLYGIHPVHEALVANRRQVYEICFEKGTVSWTFLDKFVSIKTDKKEEKKKIDNRIDAMYEKMWKSIINNKLEKFEMESVYNSLNIISQISD